MEGKHFILFYKKRNIKFRLFIYECSQTIGRKNRIVKQLNSSIHSILFVHFYFLFFKKNIIFYLIRYTDNKVFLALNHGQLCVFKRNIGIFIN